jgi:hypothetical protein
MSKFRVLLGGLAAIGVLAAVGAGVVVGPATSTTAHSASLKVSAHANDMPACIGCIASAVSQ